MCEPTLAVMGVSAALSIVSAVGQNQAQNAAAKDNRTASIQAMNNSSEANSQRFVENSRAAVQEGFDLALQGRAKESTSYASAMTSGVSGISVNETIADLKSKTARGQSRIDQEQQARKDQFSIDSAAIVAQADSRINGVQPGNPLELGANIVGALAPLAGAAAGKLSIPSASPQVGGNFGATRSGAAGDGLRG